MTDPDFEELAALWQEPDEAERAQFEALASRARRQGRFLAYADIAWFALIGGGSIFALLIAPGPLTMAGAAILLVATVWLTWKRRILRQMSRTLDTDGREAFLDSSMRNARADLRRVNLSLAVFPLLVPLALILKISFRTGAEVVHPADFFAAWLQSTRGFVTLVLLAGVVAYMVRSRKKTKAEMRRLVQLREAYEAEARRERESHS